MFSSSKAMTQQISVTRLFDLTDKMKHAANNKGLDEKALRAQLMQLRSKLNHAIALLAVDTAKDE
jgi:hypothetical protein